MDEKPIKGNPEREPASENTDQTVDTFTMISVGDYYDLLMEQQEQM